MKFTVHFKEKLYLGIMIAVSMLLYAGLALAIFLWGYTVLLPCIYLGVFCIFSLLAKVYFVGFLRGNGIKVGPQQFPEVFEIVKVQSSQLGLEKAPTVYLLQGHGILNALAMRFTRRNYVVIYSEVLATAYQEGLAVVEFIIGHELGHITRNHVSTLKTLFLFPAQLVPFLGWAYSRACEYTCDAIGYALCPEGAEKGLVLLAAGKALYKKVNVHELLLSARAERGCATWFAEIFSTHPHLTKRIAVLTKLRSSDMPEHAFIREQDKSAVRDFTEHAQ
jgi:Zn-dependent protease with chaperone function